MARHLPARLAALALVQTRHAQILSSSSATLTLERWCRDHRLAAVPRVVARPLPGPGRTPSLDHRPFAEVREVYQRDILAFSPPSSR